MTPNLSRRELAHRLFARTRTPAPRPGAAVAIPFERHLLARATFGRNEAALAELRQMGPQEWIEYQLEPEAIDDSAVEATLENLIEPWLGAAPDVRLLMRAMYSRRQLAWRMVHFLNNHFSTNRLSTQAISETREDDAFYKVCFTDFATVLRTSATSPAMIDFLDNRSNLASSPNENYARELFELHTLGVGGGYTEPDVAAAARVFTGWSRTNTTLPPATTVVASHFRFIPSRHDTGPKTLSLGWSTPGIRGVNGYLEGLQLLDFLAAHPSTAAFFTFKLCRYFAADQPPAGLRQRVQQVFTKSRGNLKATLRALFLDEEFGAPDIARDKVHDGFELVANVVRRLEIPDANPRTLNTRIGTLGGQPHSAASPAGFPEVGPPWQGAGNVLPRWTFAEDLVQNRISGVRIPWSTLFGAGMPGSAAQWVDALLDRLVDSDVPPTTTAALTSFFSNRLLTLPPAPSLTQLLPHLRDLTSLILRLPEANLT